MLVKDTLKVNRLNYVNESIVITVHLDFTFNENLATLELNYTPLKDKLEQKSIVQYLTKLLQQQQFCLEDLTFRVLDDCFDMCVPLQMSVKLNQITDEITTQVVGHKKQPDIVK